MNNKYLANHNELHVQPKISMKFFKLKLLFFKA